MFFKKVKKWTKINVQNEKNRVRLLAFFLIFWKDFKECSATFEECSLNLSGYLGSRLTAQLAPILGPVKMLRYIVCCFFKEQKTVVVFLVFIHCLSI
jgi:hypothetical protein